MAYRVDERVGISKVIKDEGKLPKTLFNSRTASILSGRILYI